MKVRRAIWILVIVTIGVLGLLMSCFNPLSRIPAFSPKALTAKNAITPDLPLSVQLYAGQTINVGEVEVLLEGDDLCVRYTTDWLLTETHLEVVTDPADFPQTRKGNPIPGHFSYKEIHSPGMSTCEYSIPRDEFKPGDTLYFAAHAEVEQWVDGVCVNSESAWADGEDFPGANWATYFAGAMPSMPDLTGVWKFWLMSDDPEEGPYLLYFKQDGTTITGMYGITGEIDGTDLVFYLVEPNGEEEDVIMIFTGHLVDDEVRGTWTTNEDPPPEPIDWHMIRPNWTFGGTLKVEGEIAGENVDIDTTTATGAYGPILNARVIRFSVDHPVLKNFEIRSWGQDFAVNPPSNPSYWVFPFSPTEAETGYEIISWTDDPEDHATSTGELIIDAYTHNQWIDGTFDSYDPSSTMNFFLDIYAESGTVYINSQQFTVTNVQEYSVDFNEVAVIFFDVEKNFVLVFSNGQQISTEDPYTSFSSGNLLSSKLIAEFGGGEGSIYEHGWATSGTINFTEYNPATGMSGTFDDVNLIGRDSHELLGTVSGEFTNVPFEVDVFY